MLGSVIEDCPVDQDNLPVTFKSDKAFVRFGGREGSENLNVSLHFRTYEESGLLMYHSFSNQGFVSLSIEEGRVKVRVSTEGVASIEIDNFDQTYNDGKWHALFFSMSKNYASLILDNDRAETRRILDFSTGIDYMIGGGIYGHRGFVGCMKQITIDGDLRPPTDWTADEFSSRDDFAFDLCLVTDRCTPNPCEHGGLCKQSSQEFYCECEGTG